MSVRTRLPADEQQIKDTLWAFAVQSPDHAVLILDGQGDVTWCNGGANALLAAGPEGLVGRNLAEFFIPLEAELGIPQHEINEALRRGSAIDDRWLQRLDGTRFWASGVTVHLQTAAACCVLIKIFRDLTDTKMQLELAKEAFRTAMEENNEKSCALAVLAHEMRNPLLGVSLAAGLMKLGTDIDTRWVKSLDVIEHNVGLASRLIQDLLQHSKISSDQFAVERGRWDLRELLTESIEIAGEQVGQSGRVEPLLLPAGRLEVCVDRARMQQVFVNIIANAIRYTDVPGRIWVSGTQEGGEVVVRVTDQGSGIAPEKLGHLFEAFTLPRLGDSKLGLGLGLMVVKKIVEAHHGTVQVRSEGVSRGSQFIVRFPRGI